MTARYGCWGRPPFAPYYLPTGAPDTPHYRIPHVFTRDCRYRLTELGKADAKCDGCKHANSSQTESADAQKKPDSQLYTPDEFNAEGAGRG